MELLRGPLIAGRPGAQSGNLSEVIIVGSARLACRFVPPHTPEQNSVVYDL
jgi:hypothetical protein